MRRFDAVDARFDQFENRLLNALRDMQTELFRAMDAHWGPIELRLRKLEADHSNLDAALSGRVDILERRLGEIEQRLAGA